MNIINQLVVLFSASFDSTATPTPTPTATMKLPVLSTTSVFATATMATHLLVADNSGSITTFSLTEDAGKYSLKQTAQSQGCAPNPSWLTLDAGRGEVYCLNEGLDTTNGSLSSFLINGDGR